MATYNQMQVQQKPKFSVAITTKGYQSLISNTLRDPARARRFTASITSAVAVNPALQECAPDTPTQTVVQSSKSVPPFSARCFR